MATYSTIAELKFKADAAELVAAGNAYDKLVAKTKTFAATTAQTTNAQNQTTTSTKSATTAADKFVEKLKQMEAQSGKTKLQILELKAAQMGVSAAAAPYIKSMQDAADKTERWAKITNAAKTAGIALGTALVAAGAAALASAKSIIDGLDALNDIADATGSTIENISALEDVAKRTGAPMEVVSTALVKLNAELRDATGKDGTSKALKAIGLSAIELRKEDPAEAMRKIAVALNDYADDANKARLVQEIFGKSIKEVGPYLKDLGEQKQLDAKTTATATAEAEKFNKMMFEMKKNSEDAGRAIIKDLLPALNAMLRNFLDIKATGGLGAIVRDATYALVGQNRMTGNNGADINKTMKERDAVMAERDKWDKDNSNQTPEWRSRTLGGYDAKLKEIEAALSVMRIKQRNEVLNGAGDQDYGDAVSRKFDRPKPSVKAPLGGFGAKDAKEKDEKDPYGDALSKIRSSTNESLTGLKTEEDLNAAQKERIKLQEEVRNGKLKINDAQKKELEAALSLWDLAIREEKESKTNRDAEKKHADEMIKLNAERADISKQYVDSYKEMFDSMQEELDNRNKSTREIKLQSDLKKIEVDLQKELNELIEKQASVEEQNAARARANDRKNKRMGFEDEHKKQDDDVWGGLIAGVKDYADVYKSSFDSMREIGSRTAGTIENGFLNMARNGKLNVKDMAASIMADFAAIATKAAVSGIAKLVLNAAAGYFMGSGNVGGVAGSAGGLSAETVYGAGSGWAANRASGGMVAPGEIYQVNEQSGESYAMFGSAGKITAGHNNGGSGGATIHAPVSITIQGNADDATIMKMKAILAENNRQMEAQIGGRIKQGIIAEQRPRGLLA